MSIVLLRIVFFVLVLAGWLGAQPGSGIVSGTVQDGTGGAVPDAAVTLVHESSGARQETRSNAEGRFRIPALLAGTYTVEVAASGFERLVQTGVTVSVGQTAAVAAVVQVGQSTQTLVIEAAAPLANTQGATLDQVVDRKMVSGMPLPNRAATALVALAPGVVMIDSGQGAEGYPVFSVAGGRARNQNFTLDGGNVTNAVGLTRPQQMTSLPMDAMQEFRVITNNYAAEHGHSTGGVIELTTRSGTNELHGSAFEYLRNNALDARNFFSLEKAPLRMHQFGFTAGGPVRRDRTHLFGSWEQSRQLSSVTALQTVPGAAERSGDFSGLRDAGGRMIPIYDPATGAARRLPFPGNRIPAVRVDPVAGRVVNYWPAPNRGGAVNFGANNNSSLLRNIVVAKLDHQWGVKDHFSARYYANDSFVDNRGAFGIPESDPDANRNDARIESVLGSHTHVFGPSVVNELKFTALQRKFVDSRYGAGADLAGSLGLRGVSAAAFPAFTVPGYASLSSQVSRVQTPIRDLQFLEALSWFRGRHGWKAGVEHRRGSNAETRDRSSAGAFTISPLVTSLPGASGTGNAVASLLLGEVNAASVLASDEILSRAYYWSAYVQDDWRVTDRLTLNVGLRWESELPRRVDGDRQNSFAPDRINPVSGTPGTVVFSGRNGVPRPAFAADLNNFGPRAGFAYRLATQKTTVIRGGGGLFYGPTVSNLIGDAAALGFSTAVSLVAPQAELQSALRLREGFPAFARPAADESLGAVAPGVRPHTAVTFFEPRRPTPVSYQYNVNLQSEVARDTVLEAGYMANVSHHLTANDLSLNQVPPQLVGPGDAQSRRPYPQFSNVSILNPAIGNSTYHAGFVRAERRFARNVSFLAHYTFSKFLDDVASSSEYGDTQSYMDAYNRRLDKGLSGSDVPHRLVLSGLYEAPGRKGRGSWLRAAAGDWKLGAFLTVQSGAPFTVVTAANTTNAFSAGPLRPNLTGNPALGAGSRSIERWFDTGAFAAPAPFTFGDSPRNGLRAPGQTTLDLQASREFTLGERLRFDVRGEFYNSLNHANFELPGHTLGAADFGTILSARPARTVQLGARLSF